MTTRIPIEKIADLIDGEITNILRTVSEEFPLSSGEDLAVKYEGIRVLLRASEHPDNKAFWAGYIMGRLNGEDLITSEQFARTLVAFGYELPEMPAMLREYLAKRLASDPELVSKATRLFGKEAVEQMKKALNIK